MEKYEGTIYGVLTAFVLCVFIVQVSSCNKSKSLDDRLQEESVLKLKETCIKEGGSVIIGERSYNMWNCVQGRANQIGKTHE